MAKVGEYPRVRLTHVHSEEEREYIVIATHKIRYSLHQIPVPRPATGVVVDTVACGSCDAHLEVRVFSPAERLRAKLRWLAVLLVGAVIAVVGTSALVALDQADDLSVAPMLLWLLTNAIGLGAVVTGGLYLCTEDGVRLPSFWRDPSHRLRRW